MVHTTLIAIDSQACTGCRTCEVVCSLFHEQRCRPAESRIAIAADYEHSLLEPRICRLCDSPDCVAACPTGALDQDARTMVIAVNRETCNGCQACVEVCSYQAIRWSPELERIFVCDRCGGEPACVQFCTSGALMLGTIDGGEG